MKINIVTGVNARTIEYFKYLKKNMEGLKSQSCKLTWNVAHGGVRCDAGRELSKDQKKYLDDNVDVVVDLKNDIGGDAGHANAINSVLNHDGMRFDEGEFTLITDIDIVIVKRNYDALIEDVFDRMHLDVFGLDRAYNKSDERICMQQKSPLRYMKHPTLQWILFKNRADVDLRKLNCNPAAGKSIFCSTQDVADFWGLPLGAHLMCDSGWMVPIFIRDNGLKFSCIKNACVIEGGGNIFYKRLGELKMSRNVSHQEGILENGETFLCHQQLAQRHEFLSNEAPSFSKFFYAEAERYIKCGDCSPDK